MPKQQVSDLGDYGSLEFKTHDNRTVLKIFEPINSRLDITDTLQHASISVRPYEGR